MQITINLTNMLNGLHHASDSGSPLDESSESSDPVSTPPQEVAVIINFSVLIFSILLSGLCYTVSCRSSYVKQAARFKLRLSFRIFMNGQKEIRAT